MPIARAGVQYIPPGTGGGSGSPGGTSGQLQYNNAGSFGGLSIGAGLVNSGGSLVNTAALAAADVVAAGTNQGTATVLAFATNTVTGGTGGVILPQGSTFGVIQMPVANRSGASITVYPYSGDTIESNSVNAGIALANNQTATFWYGSDGIVRYR